MKLSKTNCALRISSCRKKQRRFLFTKFGFFVTAVIHVICVETVCCPVNDDYLVDLIACVDRHRKQCLIFRTLAVDEER